MRCFPCVQNARSALHRNIEDATIVDMKTGFSLALALICCLAAGHEACAQAPAAPSQNKPAETQKPSPKPADPNAFPEDNNAPVLPTANSPASDSAASSNNYTPVTAPADDTDPARSPDDPVSDSSSTDAIGFSSSTTGLDRLKPPPDADSHAKGRMGGKNAPQPTHQETAAEDVNVGGYYLSDRNWHAALSRFQSAMVLDPDNPDVYWGMAEAQRHLNDFASAKANYQKLLDYDPENKHAKEARKLLKDPELANAPTASVKPPAATQQN
jgi:tetratricopeptide (TPR) repeat protein